jgi:hypothetical protein
MFWVRYLGAIWIKNGHPIKPLTQRGAYFWVICQQLAIINIPKVNAHTYASNSVTGTTSLLLEMNPTRHESIILLHFNDIISSKVVLPTTEILYKSSSVKNLILSIPIILYSGILLFFPLEGFQIFLLDCHVQ